MARIHPITGMRLEDGSGALPDDQQALLLHVPYIEQTQGEEAAAEMRQRILLDKSSRTASAEFIAIADSMITPVPIAEFVPQFEE